MLSVMVLISTLFLGDQPSLTSLTGNVTPGASATRVLVERKDPIRSVVISLVQPGHLGRADAIRTMLKFGSRTLTKTLNAHDPDVTWQIPSSPGSVISVELTAPGSNQHPVGFQVSECSISESDDGVMFEVEPNDDAATAQKIQVGRTVYASADDRPEYPQGEMPTEIEQNSGKDWYQFEFDGKKPKLAFFGIEFVDRDVPPDVRLLKRDASGKLVEYLEGIDPQSLQRERPPRPGANKFTTRVLIQKGTYFIQVDACHPDYQLRTKLYDVPPYLSKEDEANPERVAEAARKSIRVAMDFQLLAGDSWHANTPRKGQPTDRVANPHHETSTCVACHPTHFTTQSVLAAERQGYRIEEPFALKFLSERLYNNPVPLHGYPGAVWARMIPAPANVLGRLSTMMMDFENDVSGTRRDRTHEAIGNFLKLYYDGRTEIPPDETNGNNPISRYKVATDSWRQLSELVRRTNQEGYAETRNLVAQLLVTGKPDNTRDLAAQTIGLCQVDPVRHRALIESNVRRLLELQRPNGHWSPKFDPAYPHATMQTGESLHALRLAGLSSDHPAVRKGLVAILREQGSFGGWLDLSKYEQFQTPFRETQWSLIALSSHYPGPGTSGWNSPLGPQPAQLDHARDSLLIQGLERIWDDPTAEVMLDVIQTLKHANPQVRLAACEALARVGRGETVRPLVGRLGDESKLVRRASAEALRLIGNRIMAGNVPDVSTGPALYTSAIAEALKATNDLTRRGAVRIFASHFRELSREHSLADALLERLDDQDPMVRMGAIKGLWRWWYWQSEEGLRNRIEDRLIAHLARDEHPFVRRNLIEALYIIGDENIRYLYKNWVPSLALQSTRDRVTEAQHETTARLVRKYVVVLDQGSRLQKEGVLRAMSEFYERPGGQGRVGNDTEPMLAYGKAVPVLVEALSRRMSDDDALIRRLALEACVVVRGSADPALALGIAGLRVDENEEVRGWAAQMAKEFPLALKKGVADQATLALVDRLSSSGRSEPKVAALEILEHIGSITDPKLDRSAIVHRGIQSEVASVRTAAFKALAAYPSLLASPENRKQIEKDLEAVEPELRVAALRLSLDRAGLVTERAIRKALGETSPSHRLALLSNVGSSKADLADLRIVSVISDSIVDENGGVREKGLQVIQSHPSLLNNPAIEAGLREISASNNARQKEIAKTLLASRGRSSGADSGADLLDQGYFETRVLPILNRMGEDGQNCVGCHRSHSILKLQPPGADGRWTPQSVRSNYRSALRVVNLAKPSESLLLAKPTWDAFEEAEAQNDPTKKAHAGGIRFVPGSSSEYQTILDWINGARMTPPPKGRD